MTKHLIVVAALLAKSVACVQWARPHSLRGIAGVFVYASRLCCLIAATVLTLSSIADASAIALTRSGAVIYVGADASLTNADTMSLINAAECKLHVGPRVVFAFVGLSRILGFNFHDLGAKAAAQATSGEAAIKYFLGEQSSLLGPILLRAKIRGGPFWDMLVNHRTAVAEEGLIYEYVTIETHPTQPRVIIGQVLFSMATTPPMPSMADIRVYTKQEVCPDATCGEGILVHLGEGQAMSWRIPSLLLSDKPYTEKLLDALEFQALATPALVSKPFSLLQVGQEITWLERGNCK